MTKKLDPDIKYLKLANKSIRLTSEKMRLATLQFLWDRYVIQPNRDKLKLGKSYENP